LEFAEVPVRGELWTTRSAALANILEHEKSLDLNGIILLSQILNFDDSVDQPQFNPGWTCRTYWRCPRIRHGVVPPQAAEPARRARTSVERSRKLRVGRLLAGAGGGIEFERRTQIGNRDQASRL